MKYLMVYNANVHLSIPEIVGLSSAKEYWFLFVESTKCYIRPTQIYDLYLDDR